MISHIQGKLTEKTPTDVVVDCSGVGYGINISLHTYSLLPEADFVKLYTHLIVREDSHTLYGFIEKTERQIFILLLSVSGIGANTARTMLSSLNPDQIKTAIATGNVSVIQGVKGIGAKTAQRVILDLKDKILKLVAVDDIENYATVTLAKDEALAALEVLGIAKKMSEKYVDVCLKENADFTTEELIKQVLKRI